MSQEILNRLAALGHELPEASAPRYCYEPTVRSGDLLHVSGQIPRRNDVVEYTGCVGGDRTIEEGVEAAQVCALNLLAQVHRAVGLSNVVRLVKLNGFVSSAPDFYQQPVVIDGASALLRSVLGEAGGHARTALGVPMLPSNSLVEIDAVFEVR